MNYYYDEEVDNEIDSIFKKIKLKKKKTFYNYHLNDKIFINHTYNKHFLYQN